jgi:hypothetical protein
VNVALRRASASWAIYLGGNARLTMLSALLAALGVARARASGRQYCFTVVAVSALAPRRPQRWSQRHPVLDGLLVYR